MRFVAFASVLFAAVGIVHAVDDRLLYEIPAGDTMATFTADWTSTCSTWPPAVAQGLTFSEAFLEPGDYSGQHADTEALIFCAWTNGATFPTFTTEVAASLGATELV
ncbi:hypothetical protein K438DRAFT_1772384 [Mycena galopus ATCC 62051]|nr:hypothetical protein K438DRAFT_1772384 [Mycena galopus ATCC 62051]